MIGVETLVEIHYLDRQGLNKTQIAKRLGIDRKTVRKYLKLGAEGLDQKPCKYRSILDPYKPYLQYRLEHFPELSAVKLCFEISTERSKRFDPEGLLPSQPYDGSEKTVRRYLATIRPSPHRVYKPLETLPGEQAQVDWGYVGFIQIAGKRHRLYAFSFVLSYSRIRYVQFTIRQDTVTLLRFLQDALWYIGGVPAIILFDNAKVVVSERVGSVIQFNKDLMRFALQHRFKPDACWVNDPESKGKVENSINYVQSGFFYGHPIADLDTLNHDVLQWCDEVANEKIHGTTDEIPSDRLAEERKALLQLPPRKLPVFMQVTRNVWKNCSFVFETNHYEVPKEVARKRVCLNVYVDKLEVYANNKLVAVHARCMERGKLIFGESHVDDRPYEERRRKSNLQTRFEGLGPVAPAFLRGLVRSRNGNSQDQVHKILKLAEEYGQERVHAAMSRADGFNCYSYVAIKRIVQTQLINPKTLPDDPRLLSEETQYCGPRIQVQKRCLQDYIRAGEVVTDG